MWAALPQGCSRAVPAFRLYGSWEGASGSWLLAFHNHPHSYFTAVLPVTLALLTDVRLPSCSSPNVEELHNCSTLGTAVHYARLIFFFFFPCELCRTLYFGCAGKDIWKAKGIITRKTQSILSVKRKWLTQPRGSGILKDPVSLTLNNKILSPDTAEAQTSLQ